MLINYLDINYLFFKDILNIILYLNTLSHTRVHMHIQGSAESDRQVQMFISRYQENVKFP